MVEQQGCRSVTIRQGESRLQFRLIAGNATLATGMDQEHYRSVYPALTACPIVMTVIPGIRMMRKRLFFLFPLSKFEGMKMKAEIVQMDVGGGLTALAHSRTWQGSPRWTRNGSCHHPDKYCKLPGRVTPSFFPRAPTPGNYILERSAWPGRTVPL